MIGEIAKTFALVFFRASTIPGIARIGFMLVMGFAGLIMIASDSAMDFKALGFGFAFSTPSYIMFKTFGLPCFLTQNS